MAISQITSQLILLKGLSFNGIKAAPNCFPAKTAGAMTEGEREGVRERKRKKREV